MIPHFLRKPLFSLCQNLVTPQDRNGPTLLEKTIIQSWPKIWLHLYIHVEMIPHFFRKQSFHVKMRFIPSMSQTRNNQHFCYRCLSMTRHKSVVGAATGEFPKISIVIQTLYVNYFTNMADLSTRFICSMDLHILCSENLFITENTA